MEFIKYLSTNEVDEFEKVDYDFSDKELIEKKSMVLTSAVLGVVGVDRFILGDKARGIAKAVTFCSLFIAIISMLFVIMAKVYDSYGIAVGESRTITWQDNVAIIGQDMANFMYSLIGLMVVYIAFVIVDAILCYYKNMDINYKLLKKQLDK